MTPSILLLHGFTHTGASWDPVLAALGQRCRALVPDIRGHGSASGREPVTLSAVIGDLAAVTPERFTLAGYSMGGRLALHTALAMRGRVQRLVLIGASPGIADPVQREQRRRADERLASEIERMGIEEFACRWGQAPVLGGLPRDVAARAHADRLRSTPAGLARALRGLGTGALPPVWERLRELKMPVTLVVGERDRKFVEIAAQMAARIDGAELSVVAGTGHAVHLEAPLQTARALAANGRGSESLSGQDRAAGSA